MKKTTLWILSILFIVGVAISFVFPYLLMSNLGIWWFFRFYIKFSFIVLPILTIWLGLLLTKGKWREILGHVRVLIVFAAIFLVASFCVFKWTKTVNSFGIYGHSMNNPGTPPQGLFNWYFIRSSSTPFEKEMVYVETMKSVYDLEFKKMWMFGAFVFLSAFLLLAVIPKKDN